MVGTGAKEELFERIAAARRPMRRSAKPKRPLRRWFVKCIGNEMNEYEVVGTFRPSFCPGCGGPAAVGDLPMERI